MRKSGYFILSFMLLLVWLSLYSLQLRFDLAKGEDYKGEEFLYLPRAEYIKTASLGYDQVVADLLWLKAVQHIGERKISAQGYEWIYKAIDTVTSLDPKFVSPYEVGGLILSMSDKFDLSNRLLQKGYENNPDVWNFPFYIGFNYFFYTKDYRRAADWTSKAAQIKGSPSYLPLLASRLYVEAENPAYALEFLSRMYENTPDEKVRDEIMQRMKLLKAEAEIRVMQSAADFFRKKTGAAPKSLGELVSAGLLKYIPEEPSGGRYYIDGRGVVKSTKLTQTLGVIRQGGR